MRLKLICGYSFRRVWRKSIRAWSSLFLILFCVSFCSGEQARGDHLQGGPARPPASAKPIADFTDVAAKAGLTMQNVFGGIETKKYIIETTGTGRARLNPG
jgi:hypothetical protein